MCLIFFTSESSLALSPCFSPGLASLWVSFTSGSCVCALGALQQLFPLENDPLAGKLGNDVGYKDAVLAGQCVKEFQESLPARPTHYKSTSQHCSRVSGQGPKNK